MPKSKGVDVNKQLSFYDKQLMDIYTAMAFDVTKKLRIAMENKYSTGMLIKQLDDIDKVLKKYDISIKEWADESTTEIYKEAMSLVNKDLKQLGVIMTSIQFGGLNKDAVKILAENTYGFLHESVVRIGRAANDELRTYALESIRGAIGGYETLKEASQETAKRIMSDPKFSEGYITYSNGAKHTIEDYAKMTAETTTAQIHREATQNTILEAFDGNDVIEIIGPKDEKNRPICHEFVGKLVSIMGVSNENLPEGKEPLPLLEEYTSAGGFGVNCRHDMGVTANVIEWYTQNDVDY